MEKPWMVINSGKTPIQKGVKGKFGGEKPHISFWIDEKEDIRVAIWDNGDGTAHFQVTRKNDLLNTPKPEEMREDMIPNTTDQTTYEAIIEDDDLPF